MNPSKFNPWLLLLLVAGFAAVWRLQCGIDWQFAAIHREQDELVLRSGRVVKILSLEYAPLAAEIYWTRAVQYYGDRRARHDHQLDLLWPMLDVTTTLDPNLLIAYRFGATFLSEPSPRGAGRPDLAVALLKRGIRENPDYWRFYEDMGFVYYFDVKDYTKASAAFATGGEKPGAAIWMKIMAAKIAAEGNSLETSIFLWNEVYDSTKDPEIKKNAMSHLRLLRVEEDCRRLDSLAEKYEETRGRRPSHMSELVQAGLLREEADDPEGYPYVFGPDGKAALNLKSPLLEEQLMNAPAK